MPIRQDLTRAVPAAVRTPAPTYHRPDLNDSLAKAAKPNPRLRADAVVLKRDKNRVYLAGTNDDSHYYAVAALLRMWGCRWFGPGEFGECVPRHATLAVGALDHAY